MSDMAKNNLLQPDPYEEHKRRYDEEKRNRDQSAGEKKNSQSTSEITNVVIKGFNIPFWDLVRILVQLAFASIPAAIIIAVAWFFIISFLGTIF